MQHQPLFTFHEPQNAPAYLRFGIPKSDPVRDCGQRDVTVLTRVKNLTPSMPC